VIDPPLAEVKKRLVEEAVVAKKLVEVALVVVERVMLLKMFAPVKPLLSVRRVEDAAVPDEHPVHEATVKFPIVARFEKKFVELAVVAKKLVVVAEVPVAFKKVKFWNVDDPVASKLEALNNPVVERLVNAPVVANRLVEVALVEVEFKKVKF